MASWPFRPGDGKLPQRDPNWVGVLEILLLEHRLENHIIAM